MENDIELSVALEIINRKIATLNIKMIKNPSEETKKELAKLLEMKEKIDNGDISLIKDIIGN